MLLAHLFGPILGLLKIIINHLGVISNSLVLDNLTRNNLLSDKQYRFHFFLSITDVFSVITHKINEVLNGNFVTRAFDISKAFDKICDAITASLEEFVIKYFLLGRSMMVVMNGQSSEAHYRIL